MLASRKAEASTEFMAFFGIILLFFVFFVGIIGVNSNGIGESTVYTSAQNILNTVTSEINTASRIEGYQRGFFIPKELSDGEDYNITYPSPGMVMINWTQGKSIIGNIITNNVTGNVSAGYNVIKNIGGRVNISAS